MSFLFDKTSLLPVYRVFKGTLWLYDFSRLKTVGSRSACVSDLVAGPTLLETRFCDLRWPGPANHLRGIRNQFQDIASKTYLHQKDMVWFGNTGLYYFNCTLPNGSLGMVSTRMKVHSEMLLLKDSAPVPKALGQKTKGKEVLYELTSCLRLWLRICMPFCMYRIAIKMYLSLVCDILSCLLWHISHSDIVYSLGTKPRHWRSWSFEGFVLNDLR